MNKHLQKLIDKQRALESQIAEAKRREAFGRRFLGIAQKAGALCIEDEEFWKKSLEKLVATHASTVSCQSESGAEK